MKMSLIVVFACVLQASGLVNAVTVSLNDDPLAITECSGLASVSLTKGSHVYVFDVAYAVYDSAVYNANGRFDPSQGQDKYIYAFQFFNTVNSNTNAKTFSIAVPEGVTVDNVTYDETIGIPSGILPHSEKNHASIIWTFNNNPIDIGQHSAVLLFTSNSEPLHDSITLSIDNDGGIIGDGAIASSTVPEPATVMLLSLGITFLWKK